MTPGYSKAAADSLRITVYGKGGHGARPESTIDPVLLAGRSPCACRPSSRAKFIPVTRR